MLSLVAILGIEILPVPILAFSFCPPRVPRQSQSSQTSFSTFQSSCHCRRVEKIEIGSTGLATNPDICEAAPYREGVAVHPGCSYQDRGTSPSPGPLQGGKPPAVIQSVTGCCARWTMDRKPTPFVSPSLRWVTNTRACAFRRGSVRGC